MVCRVSLDWKYKDMKTAVLENSLIRVVVLLDKGGDIMELRYKPLDINLLWSSPIGWRKPSEATLLQPNPLGVFLDCYGGGWQDITPNAGGVAITNRGASLGIHAESSILPWGCRVEKEQNDEVTIYLWVEGIRYPFLLEKWLTIRENESNIYIRERLTNTSKQELEYSWLQHPAFGEPFLEPGCRIKLPEPATVIVEENSPYGRLKPGKYEWPMVMGKDGKRVDLSQIPERDIVAEETSFITNMTEGWYILHNPRLKIGFGMAWEVEVYKYLWFWQNYNTPNYPWYSRAWNIALEPCTSFPGGLEEQIRRRTHIQLGAGQRLETRLTAYILTEAEKTTALKPTGQTEHQ